MGTGRPRVRGCRPGRGKRLKGGLCGYRSRGQKGMVQQGNDWKEAACQDLPHWRAVVEGEDGYLGRSLPDPHG